MNGPVSKFAEVNLLRGRLRDLRPADMSFISMAEKPVMRRAFFPGGNGLVLGEDAAAFPVGGTMILGSNFGAEERFCTTTGELICDDETHNARTWQGLRRLLPQGELEQAFFTNAWPFLHVSKSNNPTEAEKMRWLRPPVLTACLEFFRGSLRILKPSVIITLGTAPAAFLGYAFPDVLSAWQGNNWKAIDARPTSTLIFEGQSLRCVAVTHPSMRNAHVRREDLRDEHGLLAGVLATKSEQQIRSLRSG